MASEKRLIDANALKIKLQEHHDFFVNGWSGFSKMTFATKSRVDEIDNCIAEIVNAPTVDAVEVVHGRWVFGTANHREYMKCSVCLKSQTPTGVFTYCPNCGAKMDGDGNVDV